MAKDTKKKFKNVGQRSYHLPSRVKGALHHDFGPGDIIEANSPEEEAYLAGISDVVEYKGEPKSDKERIVELEAENKALQVKVAKLEKD